jgi:hypothetical protein
VTSSAVGGAIDPHLVQCGLGAGESLRERQPEMLHHRLGDLPADPQRRVEGTAERGNASVRRSTERSCVHHCSSTITGRSASAPSWRSIDGDGRHPATESVPESFTGGDVQPDRNGPISCGLNDDTPVPSGGTFYT